MPPALQAEHDTSSGRPARQRPRMRSAYEERQRRRRLISYGLFGFSLVLMINALVGERGYLATIRAEHEYRSIVRQLHQQRLENQELQRRIQQLRTDPAALEEAAREKLGLIKPGETLYILKDRVPPDAAAGR